MSGQTVSASGQRSWKLEIFWGDSKVAHDVCWHLLHLKALVCQSPVTSPGYLDQPGSCGARQTLSVAALSAFRKALYTAEVESDNAAGGDPNLSCRAPAVRISCRTARYTGLQNHRLGMMKRLRKLLGKTAPALAAVLMVVGFSAFHARRACD